MNADIEELTKLNKAYVDSVQNSDVRRFDEILADDFYSTLPDKTFVDRKAFLEFTAIPVKIKGLEAQDVKIRVMDDLPSSMPARVTPPPMAKRRLAVTRNVGQSRTGVGSQFPRTFRARFRSPSLAQTHTWLPKRP
jgi:hypothetical protein